VGWQGWNNVRILFSVSIVVSGFSYAAQSLRCLNLLIYWFGRKVSHITVASCLLHYLGVSDPLYSNRIKDFRIQKIRTFSNRQEAEMVQYVLSVELQPIRKRKRCSYAEHPTLVNSFLSICHSVSLW